VDVSPSRKCNRINRKLAERVGFEPACKRKLKDLQRTGSDLEQGKFTVIKGAGFQGVSGRSHDRSRRLFPSEAYLVSEDLAGEEEFSRIFSISSAVGPWMRSVVLCPE
jgi:hypothetical protein